LTIVLLDHRAAAAAAAAAPLSEQMPTVWPGAASSSAKAAGTNVPTSTPPLPVAKLTDFGVAIDLPDGTLSRRHVLTAETGTYRYNARAYVVV
jgi:hypothetical protein